jgi:hypothetical protein
MGHLIPTGTGFHTHKEIHEANQAPGKDGLDEIDDEADILLENA